MAKKYNSKQEQIIDNFNEEINEFHLGSTEESIDLEEFNTETILDKQEDKESLEPKEYIEHKVQKEVQRESLSEVVDIRRVPNKRGINSKHTIKSGTDTSVEQKQYETDKLNITPVKQNNNLIKTNIPLVNKTKKEQYVPNLVGKKYKIYSNGKVVYDSILGGAIKFGNDWLEIGTTKYFYDKINFVL